MLILISLNRAQLLIQKENDKLFVNRLFNSKILKTKLKLFIFFILFISFIVKIEDYFIDSCIDKIFQLSTANVDYILLHKNEINIKLKKNRKILIILTILKIILNEILIFILMIKVDLYLLKIFRKQFRKKIQTLKNLNSDLFKIKLVENMKFKKLTLILFNLFILLIFKLIILLLNVFILIYFNGKFFSNYLQEYDYVFHHYQNFSNSLQELTSFTYILTYSYSILFYNYLDTNFNCNLRKFFHLKEENKQNNNNNNK
jgi:hypothetical protein